jgi:hypothetical protein
MKHSDIHRRSDDDGYDCRSDSPVSGFRVHTLSILPKPEPNRSCAMSPTQIETLPA